LLAAVGGSMTIQMDSGANHGSRAAAVIACLVVTVIAAVTGGVRSPFLMAYPAIILIDGWICRGRAVMITVALVMVFVIGLWAAELQGVLPSVVSLSPVFYGIHALVIVVLAAVLMVFIVKSHQRQLADLNLLSHELADYANLLEQNSNLLERAQEVAKIGSWVADMASQRIVPSTQGCQILGIEPGSSLTFQDYLARVHEEDQAGVLDAWKKALSSHESYTTEHRITLNGTIRWVRQKVELEAGQNGKRVSAIGITQDITERKLLILALKESEKRHRTLIEWMPEAILVHNNTRIVYANPAAIKLFGADDLPSLMLKSTNELIHPDYMEAQRDRMRRLQAGWPIAPKAEARFLKLDGSAMDVQVQGTAIEFDGQPAIQVSVHDITERKRMENQIRQLAFYDSLTDLPNRRLLNDRLQQVISANRRSACFSALMFLDLDNFKPINDQHGHSVGDLMLVEAAARLKTCVREMDTVARFGGDEFVVLLTELDTDRRIAHDQANNVAKKISAAMSKPYVLQTHNSAGDVVQVKHQCSASIGVVVYSSLNTHPDELTKLADAAMYQAKNDGRNRISFSVDPDDSVDRQISIPLDLD
jgi:diguanylate cyclase (GGDEF)-like protein/PAS domain S-box-containing protein